MSASAGMVVVVVVRAEFWFWVSRTVVGSTEKERQEVEDERELARLWLRPEESKVEVEDGGLIDTLLAEAVEVDDGMNGETSTGMLEAESWPAVVGGVAGRTVSAISLAAEEDDAGMA